MAANANDNDSLPDIAKQVYCLHVMRGTFDKLIEELTFHAEFSYQNLQSGVNDLLDSFMSEEWQLESTKREIVEAQRYMERGMWREIENQGLLQMIDELVQLLVQFCVQNYFKSKQVIPREEPSSSANGTANPASDDSSKHDEQQCS